MRNERGGEGERRRDAMNVVETGEEMVEGRVGKSGERRLDGGCSDDVCFVLRLAWGKEREGAEDERRVSRSPSV